MTDPVFWSGRRVFLTGHTGFKGAWLSLWLQLLGAKVTGYSVDIPSRPSLFEAAQLAGGMADLRADINNLDALTKAMARASPEVIIHAAAQSLVRPSYADPIGTFQTNIIGTANVLQAARAVDGLRVVLILTSDKCYENQEWLWAYRETDPMGGHDPYSASKGAAEIVTASMRRAFFNPEKYQDHRVAVASARSGNVIGGGDWSTDRLLPDLIRAFSSGVPALIRNPSAIRPWQFVLDPLAGYLRLCECLWTDGPKFAEGWNFGPEGDDGRPVAELAEMVRQQWGPDAVVKLAEGPAPHEAGLLRLDTAKARHRLGWRAKTHYETAIRLTVEWYRSFYTGDNPRICCERQIEKWRDQS